MPAGLLRAFLDKYLFKFGDHPLRVHNLQKRRMLQRDLTKDIKNRLNTVKGQIEGIVRMLDDDKDPELILNQFKAAGKALGIAQELLIDEAFRKSLAAKISEAFQSCPGDCGQEDIIEMLRTQFPTIQPDDLTKKMKEIQVAYDQMNNNKHLDTPQPEQ